MKSKHVMRFALALVALGVGYYIFSKDQSSLLISGTGILVGALALFMQWQATKENHFEELHRSWLLKFAEMEQKFSGLKDHVTNQNLIISNIQSDVAHMEANSGADSVEKLKDRLENVEARLSIGQAFGVSTPSSQSTEYRPKPKRQELKS